MTAGELRTKFLDFFSAKGGSASSGKEKGHTIIPSASLIPENDPTVLFTTAGMHPLVPYLLGEKHPGGSRLASVQKCIRTVDIDEVGDATHHTFFEMLGNWSLGDPSTTLGAGYFKKEAIQWSWEFLTSENWLGLDKDRMAVSVFAGDQDAPFDEESFNIWREFGVTEKRIAKLPKKNNWWGPAGETGPCGPDTEMFYWVGDPAKVPDSFNDDNDLWVEIWNDVFMEYNKKADGTYEKLGQRNVDTGMGLERVLAVMNGLDDNYQTELFWPIIEKIEELSRKKYGESAETTRAMRIIADHIKAAVFIIADGVVPDKSGSGYVLRRLIRRARYYYDSICTEKNMDILVESVIPIYKDNDKYIYRELSGKNKHIEEVIRDEELTFVGHLMFGRRLLGKLMAEEKYISDDNAFLLYSTYGFPFELILDIAKEKNIKVDTEGFNKKRMAHQELSRTASAGMFKGGLADAGEQAAKLHTATHLLQAALRKVLGEQVAQKGSNITAERLRFDFSYDKKMTKEEIKKVGDLVNERIRQDIPVEMKEMTVEEAKKGGALGVFDSKYGERVKVYTVSDPSISLDSELDSRSSWPPFSREICGGPHAKRTGELGKFRIVKEEASSAGVRRIKAVLE
ncbi:MAG: alanine--tRNA ligase [Candidatus Portnoybacteria bacterium]|nr:alanine--tRNA ligase [Candidatus Portnoybacteria bacterium]